MRNYYNKGNEEDETNMLTEGDVCKMITKKRIQILKNPVFQEGNYKYDYQISVITWLTNLQETLKMCGIQQEYWKDMLLDCLAPEERERVSSLVRNKEDFEDYKKMMLCLYFSKDQMPVCEDCEGFRSYLRRLKEYCSGLGGEGDDRELKQLIYNCYAKKLISDVKLETFQDLIKEIEFKNIDSGLKRRKYYSEELVVQQKDIIIDRSFSFGMCLKVPSEIWELMLPKDGHRRQTSLSLLQSCSSLRNHLLPKFQIQNPNQFRSLFEGYYFKKGFKDYKLYLHLERETYFQIIDYYEKSVQSEGTWSILKRDLSNNYYALQIQFDEKSSIMKQFSKSQQEVENYFVTPIKWKPKPTLTLIFSRFPKINLPIGVKEEMVPITIEHFQMRIK